MGLRFSSRFSSRSGRCTPSPAIRRPNCCVNFYNRDLAISCEAAPDQRMFAVQSIFADPHQTEPRPGSGCAGKAIRHKAPMQPETRRYKSVLADQSTLSIERMTSVSCCRCAEPNLQHKRYRCIRYRHLLASLGLALLSLLSDQSTHALSCLAFVVRRRRSRRRSSSSLWLGTGSRLLVGSITSLAVTGPLSSRLALAFPRRSRLSLDGRTTLVIRVVLRGP